MSVVGEDETTGTTRVRFFPVISGVKEVVATPLCDRRFSSPCGRASFIPGLTVVNRLLILAISKEAVLK